MIQHHDLAKDGPSGAFGYMAGSRPGPVIHGMEVDMNSIVQPKRSLQGLGMCVGGPLESQAPKTTQQVVEQERQCGM